MKKALLLFVCLLLAPLAMACAAGVAEYRPLDLEARAIQSRLLAGTGPIPDDAVAALLAFNPSAPPDVRSFARVSERFSAMPAGESAARVWLAKDWIHRGHLDGAAALLASTGTAEARLLLADVLVRQDRAVAAADVLAGVRSPQDLASYARFNRAILLDRAGDVSGAAALFDELGRMDARGTEMLALRDKANIALGFARLRDGNLAGARAALERVRLESPFSDQALFGLGWVSLAGGDAARALVPWSEIRRDRRAVDRVNDETRLLVPRAQGSLGAYGEAVDQYQAAVEAFERDLAEIDRLIAGARSGALEVFDAGAVSWAALPARSPVFGAAQATYRYLQSLERTHVSLVANAGLTQRVARAVADHREWLRGHAVAVLEAERVRTAEYRERARFALARLLDDMAAARRDGEG